MQPKVITPPTQESITRAEAKLHLRLDDVGGVHPDDAIIDGLITGAREYAEHYTQRSIGSQTLEMALDAFPSCSDAIELPQGPTTGITTVTYVDTAGVTQAWSAANYTLDDYSVPARLVLAYGASWPSTRCVVNAVKVRYVAGAATLPKQVKAAMLLHIQLHYPGNSYTEQERESILRAVDGLLAATKVWGF